MISPVSPVPAITIDHASFRLNGRVLVDDLSFSVNRGETLVLLGRSGSGKTTSLKLINRLLLPSSGAVRVDGKSTTDWDPIRLRRSIGYVIQDGGLFPHFTVARNIALVPKIENWPREKIDARVRELLTLVGLSPDLADRYPEQLSGGQRQRVGVARALAADPPILLLDEPFGALDPITRSEMQKEFRDLQQRMKKAVIFVTHDLREALLLADRVALMEDGRLIANLPVADFPHSQEPLVKTYVAAFSGAEPR
ncbi:MAG TPA: ATP-binding cassette domain-containing protein [Terriglobales bacterium]|nr:ATP-binding cassette domain-containing protein [Terriglobales bacterium]